MTRIPLALGDRVLATGGTVAVQLAQDLAVEIEVARRLDRMRE